jgi:hypothetical protein
MKNAKPKLIYLEWIDHWGMGGGWKDVNDIKDPGPMLCRSVGWLVKEDKEGYYLASGICLESGAPHSSIQYILKVALKKKQWVHGI